VAIPFQPAGQSIGREFNVQNSPMGRSSAGKRRVQQERSHEQHSAGTDPAYSMVRGGQLLYRARTQAAELMRAWNHSQGAFGFIGIV